MFEGNKKKDATEVVAKRQQEKQEKALGFIRPHRGHTLFKVDAKTLEITEAKFEDTLTTSVNKAKMTVIHKKVIIEDGYVYVSALNKKNVSKKLPRLGIDINKHEAK